MDRNSRKEACPCVFYDTGSQRILDHTVGVHMPPVFRCTVLCCEKVSNIHFMVLRSMADGRLPRPGRDRVRFCEIPQVSPWACGHPPSSSNLWISAILWESTALWRGPQTGYCKPTSRGFALAVKCYVLGRLSSSDWERYVGLFASEVVDGRCLASYSNRLPSLSTSSPVLEGNQHGRRGFVVTELG
jgi:hypothetical protein